MLRKISRQSWSAVLSAALLVCAFPSVSLPVCAWFGLVPLLLAIDGARPGRAFRLSYLTGFLFWLGTIYWLANVTAAGMVVLAAYLALYFGAFGYVCGRFRLLQSRAFFVTVPALWVVLEYLRCQLLTGFGWSLLAYSQTPLLPMIQSADIAGPWGVSFLLVVFNTLVFAVAGRRVRAMNLARPLSCVVVCCAVVLGYGYWRIAQVRALHTQPLMKLATVQPNIPQKLKWDPAARPYILSQYTRIAGQAGGARPDLMVWPEAASPVVLGEDDALFYRIAALSEETGIPFLMGVVRFSGEAYFNSAALIDRGRGITQVYDKLHLVPFGEYIPLKRALPFLEVVVPIGEISPGVQWTRIVHNGVPFSVLICFEDLFPEISRGFVRRGARFLVNITNDAWYLQAAAAEQHAQASVFRAVENRVDLVRSANTGVSGIIRADGSAAYVHDRRGQRTFSDGFLAGEVWAAASPYRTVYTRCGDWFVACCAACAVVFGTVFRLRRQRV